jgi:hypothetical protein
VVKSNGDYLYIARRNSLRIVATPAGGDVAQIGALQIADEIDSLYLVGDKLLALCKRYAEWDRGQLGAPEILIWPPYYQAATTVIHEIDVSNAAVPAISKSSEFDGLLVTSRIMQGALVLVLTIQPELPAERSDDEIAPLTLGEVLPHIVSDESSPLLVAPTDWYRPGTPNGYLSTAIVSIDSTDISRHLGSAGVMTASSTIYASSQAIYLSEYDYDGTEEFGSLTATLIHRFALDENRAPKYTATGVVPGTLLNQFSLGEYDGTLRVATHIQPVFVAQAGDTGVAVGVAGSAPDEPVQTALEIDTDVPVNAVYCLAIGDNSLAVAGAIQGIAPNERLYSARFLGARGYLVTFRAIDPLYSLDLSDPANPRITGELKIPGYSDYLHPVGDDLLIGVGRTVAQTPWGGVVPDKLQLSLFDVSNPAAPKVIQQADFGGSGSFAEASFNHKAFAYLDETGTLALPVGLRSDQYWWEGVSQSLQEFSGTLVLQVDPAAGFVEKARIANVQDSEYGWWSPWSRSVIIGEWAYAVTPGGVRSGSISDPNATFDETFAPLENEYENIWPPLYGFASAGIAE